MVLHVVSLKQKYRQATVPIHISIDRPPDKDARIAHHLIRNTATLPRCLDWIDIETFDKRSALQSIKMDPMPQV